MPSAANVHARKTARIRGSGHTVTLVYPPALVPTAAGVAPAALPASPLTGAAPGISLVPPTAPTPTQPAVTLACLWYDSPEPPRNLSLAPDARRFADVAWIDGVHAFAEVLVADVAVDAAQPYGPTKLDGAQHVEHGGQTYRVLAKRALGAGFALPVSYLVLLETADNQPAG